jgi:hypothetical protein
MANLLLAADPTRHAAGAKLSLIPLFSGAFALMFPVKANG